MHSKYPDDFFLTYYTSAEIVRRRIGETDISKKVLQNDLIPANADSYAYDGFVLLENRAAEMGEPGKFLGPSNVLSY